MFNFRPDLVFILLPTSYFKKFFSPQSAEHLLHPEPLAV